MVNPENERFRLLFKNQHFYWVKVARLAFARVGSLESSQAFEQIAPREDFPIVFSCAGVHLLAPAFR